MTNMIMNYNPDTGKPVGLIDKKTAHAELKENPETPPHKHAHVGVVLFNGQGNVLTSVRDFDAESNPDMIDKSLGGHIPAGYGTEAAILETASREFRIPTAMVSTQELYNIILNHPELLSRQAFIAEMGYEEDSISERVMQDGKAWHERCKQHYFVGVYDGSYACTTNTGIRQFPLDKIKSLAARQPGKITGDLRGILESFDHRLRSVRRAIIKERFQSTDEIVECYDLEGTFRGVEKRLDVHEPIKQAFASGDAQELKHRHIGGLLIGGSGEVYVQIRSEEKKENPGMYDKVVGGHISAGDSPIVAAYNEFIEEMAIPVALYDELTWRNILANCPEAAMHQAICRNPVLVQNYVSRRVQKDGGHFDEVCDQYFVIGYYQGSFRLVDKEASGIYQFVNRDALREGIEKKPERFTADLAHMVDRFWDELVPLEERIVERGE